MDRHYDVVALSIPIWFNKWGDHDHNGLMFALRENVGIINQYREYLKKPGLADEQRVKHAGYQFIRPLVLRACAGDTIKIKFENQITRHPKVGVHLVADGYNIIDSDGAAVGFNPSSLHEIGKPPVHYTWQCHNEGVFVFHDAGNYSGMEDGTNLHGLFGALVVEPKGTTWRNPVDGNNASDGLYVDVIPNESHSVDPTPWLSRPMKYPEDVPAGAPRKAFREYVIFFHDEVEFVPSHTSHEPDICHGQPDVCGNPPPSEHASHPLMTISYRAEPMVARQQELWRRIRQKKLKAPVVHEEQHHSSWMFGDPATPILNAYIGDPVRIRLVHAAVKETHVFHLHVYSWHHDANNRKSPIIDAISIGPQTGHTIIPLWGAGNRQGATGDVIWHCHLYPHFHEGMWGMFRTFDALNEAGNAHCRYPDGTAIAPLLSLPDREPPPKRSGNYPGFPNYIAGIPRQRSPLPPWYSAEGEPLGPGLDYRLPTEKEKRRLEWFMRFALERSKPGSAGSRQDWSHLNTKPVPGWLFNAFRLPEDGEVPPDGGEGHPATLNKENPVFLSVETQRFQYNQHCWHDPEGHLFRPVASPRIQSHTAPPYVQDHRGRHGFRHPSCAGMAEQHAHADNTLGSANGAPEPTDHYQNTDKPLFVRANHGDVVTLELENRLPRAFCHSPFDEALPPCENYTVPVGPNDGYHETDPHWKADRTPPMACGQHVHLVKFDPLVCDGASTGWNYFSGPRAPYWNEEEGMWRYLRMRYLWWVDEEFGVIFTHDHLFANFRQKRGLFGAMIAEPYQSTWHSPDNPDIAIRFGDEAVIRLEDGTSFREFCIGLGDFVPLYNRHRLPLNEPPIPGGHSDHGVVGINYRSAPIRERTMPLHAAHQHGQDPRRHDPAYWFSSHVWGDPDTPIFRSRPGDPIRLRIVQGSHEEQHSFQVHGMRWRRFINDPSSPLKNQQTLGISEQFSFDIENPYGPGDYLYKFGTADDLWMGAWGIIRVGSDVAPLPGNPRNHGSIPKFDPANARRFKLVAESQEILYCDNPALSDPKGLVYRLAAMAPTGTPLPQKGPPVIASGKVSEPLILRCCKGEWVEVMLENRIAQHLAPEPAAPMVPVELFERPVSERVSIHADLLLYDVKTDDGTTVGYNSEQFVANAGSTQDTPAATRTYRWYADVEGPILLQDLADFRNHRHHGLIGALIVEPEGTSFEVADNTRHSQATVRHGKSSFQEVVLIIQDGLRLYHFGNLSLPMADPPGDLGEPPDPTDQGQKAFNYRAQPVGRPKWLQMKQPATPVFHIDGSQTLRLHLITAADKPRNHSFTIHGYTWREWPTTTSDTRIGAVTSLSAGSVQTLHLETQKHAGDYAYRSGVLRWAVPQGLWGVLRLK